MEGERLARYRITSRLGAGGMGEVYRARDEQLDRDVAVKVLPASSFEDPTARARLVREAKSAAALKDGTRIAAGPDFIALGAKRTSAGQVEVHDKETDTFYVLDGEATFITGGKMIGGKKSRENQWLGASIEGGETHHLKKGDFISVPAGMPHWFKEVPTSINYYVVKAVKP